LIQVRKILQTAIETGIDYNIYITGYTPIGTTTRIFTCDTIHAKVGTTILIDGISYGVTAFLLNTWIEVFAPTPIDEANTFAIVSNLFFFSGKLKDTNIERAVGFEQIRDSKVPFFWSREPFTQVNESDVESEIATTVDLTFYILDTAPLVNGVNLDRSTWLTYDHHLNVIEPIQNLLESRLITYFIENTTLFNFEGNTYDVRGLAIVSVDNNTNDNLLFDELLSGVEVRLSLPINKAACNC